LHPNCEGKGVLILGYQLTERPESGQVIVEASPVHERRSAQRIRLQIPMFLRGRDLQGEHFLELNKSLNISALGALITSPRCLPLDSLVTLTIPAPSMTAAALVPAGMEPIQARVRHQQCVGDIHLVGVEFQESLA
jgi:hypothetical protein